MENKEIIDRIADLKLKLSGKVIIPAHHYQRLEIVGLGDIIGDSYKLAVEAAKSDAEFILFCGVMFMAESASIMASANQKVLIPVPMAGCPMASMADISFVEKAYNKIAEVTGKKVAPIVYMNSFADLKSFCGERGGAVCTSSNAQKIISHYLNNDFVIMFFPDYHLGKNTANEMGLGDLTTRVFRDGKLEDSKNMADMKFFLWDGFCQVHQKFKVSDVKVLREKNRNLKIIVHPEANESVVQLSDFTGSTEKIKNMIDSSMDGSTWAVGTETTFVERIALENPGKKIIPLTHSVCMNMQKITLEKVLQSLISIDEFITNTGTLKFEVCVDDKFKKFSRIALENMIRITEENAKS